jgi:heat shock protein HslJ
LTIDHYFMIRTTLLLTAVLLLFIPACSPRPAAVAGTSWTLVAYGPEDAPVALLPGTTVTLSFENENGRLGGSAGCNHYGGDYQLRGDRFTVSEIFRTVMYCPDQEGGDSKMVQEDQFLAALRSAHKLTVSGDDLHIFYDGGVLLFQRGKRSDLTGLFPEVNVAI